jgi:hypothetical protein
MKNIPLVSSEGGRLHSCVGRQPLIWQLRQEVGVTTTLVSQLLIATRKG